MKKENKPASRKENIIVQELNGEVLIYDLNEHKAFCLNETSALVWNACDGQKTVSEISKSVGEKLNAPANEDLVWLALDQLKKENLLENREALESKFAGMSRREVIRKIGFGSMVALPIVASIVAPTAANAASLLANGATCTDDSQCQSNRCRNPGCNASGNSRTCRSITECP